MFLFQKIEELMMNYGDARHAIGEFVLHEKDNLYKYTINEIAEYTYTSKATVVRFAKTLGYDGWKEFMKAFISEIKYQVNHQNDADVNYPFKENDSVETIIEKIKTLQIESIQDTADLLDTAMLEKATAYLLKARHIVIFGISPNSFLGELFRRKMITIGKQVDLARSGESGIIARTLNKDDCAIMISYSGNNEAADPMVHLSVLLENEVPTIGITSGGDNYLHRNLSCILTMSSKERLYTKIANFSTEESLQFIFNVLFANYFVKNYQDNNLYKIRNSKILESVRVAALREMKDSMEDETK